MDRKEKKLIYIMIRPDAARHLLSVGGTWCIYVYGLWRYGMKS